jgi:asparagine synthase (glutamine-hydrolysing)
MGLQAGVFAFDGNRMPDEHATIVAALAAVALERVAAVADHRAIVAHGACPIWTGERGSTQPLRSPSGLVMTWDGRLDNREDLLLRFGPLVDDEASDAAIALAAIDRAGVDGLRDLIGDWSVVVWDARRRTLHLARDYMGVRPLFYCVDDRAVRWSTSLGELAARADRLDDLDDRFAAALLALTWSTDVTPYREIRAVPTATCVTLSADGIETRRRFWRAEPGLLRYRDRRQYADHLRAVWREAVAARLRVDGAVWAELSGGLDSSSVVCMADALIKRRSVPATAIRPLSHVTLETPDGDERPFIREIEARIGAQTSVIAVETHQDFRVDEWERASPLAARGVPAAALQHVRSRGGLVLLSGRMGDLVMGCAPDNSVAVIDDFADGRIGTALSKMRSWSRACRKPFVEIAWRLLHEASLAGRGDLRRPLNKTQRSGFDLLTPRLQSLAAGLAARDMPSLRTRWSKRRFAASILGYAIEARLESPWHLHDLVYAHPFAHRPLVELMLAIPAEELSAPGETRSLMRRAFADLVPPRVLRRTSKGHYSPAVLRAVRAALGALPAVDRLEVVQRGWIDAARLAAAIRSVASGPGHAGAAVDRVLRLEQWLTVRHRRAPAAIPQRKEVTINGVLIA